ncbi:MAG: hypothetical protein ACJAZS_000855 [Alteromonas naphthalenivorans]|jgi:hypothetical protein
MEKYLLGLLILSTSICAQEQSVEKSIKEQKTEYQLQIGNMQLGLMAHSMIIGADLTHLLTTSPLMTIFGCTLVKSKLSPIMGYCCCTYGIATACVGFFSLKKRAQGIEKIHAQQQDVWKKLNEL